MLRKAYSSLVERYRLAYRLTLVAFALAFSAPIAVSRAEAACTVPNVISNGQTADATVVMDNFNALKDCVNSAVSPSGAPVTGVLPVFSSPNTITGGNLSGDCATAGSLVVTCTKSNGVPLGHFATGTDAGQLTGTISVDRFANGSNADSSHFLRGDGIWAVPPTGGGGGGAVISTIPTIVQSIHQRVNNVANANLTLPSAPTVGNLLIMIYTGPGGSAFSAPPATFYFLDGISHTTGLFGAGLDARGNFQQATWLAIRRVQPGDTATFASGSTASYHNYTLLEVANADIFKLEVATLQMLASNAFIAHGKQQPFPNLRLLVVEHDGTANVSFSAAGGVAQLSNYNPIAGNHRAAVAQIDDAYSSDVAGSFDVAPSWPIAAWLFIAKRN